MMAEILTGATVFDGVSLNSRGRLRIQDGMIAEEGPGTDTRLDGGILAPGFLDLQVNGGGGLMVDATTDVDALHRLCDVHARLGSTGIMPTLITDRPEATKAVVAAALAAARRTVPGFLGLHLEGPHLDPRRKGAHDASLIRPMSDTDLELMLEAAAGLPSLMVTLAPEAVTLDQVRRLADAGVIVSLGHSDCTCATALATVSAGARCVTHLFNAMSPLGSREPGLVGAALTAPVFAGLIADGIHVAPETIRIAMAATDRLFLVSDAMAPAGSAIGAFTLNGRRILRQNGRLTLEDGTLAGADLTLPEAVRRMAGFGTPIDVALAMATLRPAQCLGREDTLGRLLPGRAADIVHIRPDGTLGAVWRSGRRLV